MLALPRKTGAFLPVFLFLPSRFWIPGSPCAALRPPRNDGVKDTLQPQPPSFRDRAAGNRQPKTPSFRDRKAGPGIHSCALRTWIPGSSCAALRPPRNDGKRGATLESGIAPYRDLHLMMSGRPGMTGERVSRHYTCRHSGTAQRGPESIPVRCEPGFRVRPSLRSGRPGMTEGGVRPWIRELPLIGICT